MATVYAPGSVFVRPLSPVILQARPGRLASLSATVRTLDLTRMLSLGPIKGLRPWASAAFSAARQIPEFDMHAAVLDAVSITRLAQDPDVAAIYPDNPVRISQFPVTPAAGTWTVQVPSQTGAGPATLYFTSTDWTRGLLGADVANAAGYSGQGVTACVVDTGGWIHPMTRRAGSLTAIPGNRADVVSHGLWCLSALGGVRYRDQAFSAAVGAPVYCEGMAPQCGLLAIKALDFVVGTAPTSILLSALGTALSQKVDVLSLSWGSPAVGATPQADPFYPAMEALDAAGVLVFAAAGNCLAKGTLVDTPKGPLRIELLSPGDHVYSVARPEITVGPRAVEHRTRGGMMTMFQKPVLGMDDGLSAQRVLRVVPQGTRPVFRVETRRRSVEATANHPFLRLVRTKVKPSLEDPGVELRWTEVGDLHAGDVVVTAKGLPSGEDGRVRPPVEVGGTHPPVDALLLLGCYTGDGWSRVRPTNRGEFHLCLPPGVEREKYRAIIRGLFDVECHDTPTEIVAYSFRMCCWVQSAGVTGTAKTKRIPEWVFGLGPHEVSAFLEGYIEADGSDRTVLSSSGGLLHRTIGFEAANEMLITQLRDLCRRTGWAVGRVRPRSRRIRIFNGRRWYEYPDAKSWAFSAWPDSHRRTANGGRSATARCTSVFSRTRFLTVETILRITPVGTRATYDIEVEGSHNFVAGDFVVHNSGPGAATLDSPGALPQPVTVGAYNAVSNSFNSMFGPAGSVCAFSSRGPAPWGGTKPDCVAPGAIIDSGVSPFSEMAVSYTQRPHGAQAIAGTSMATPQAAGMGVLMRQAHRQLLGRTLTNAEVKAMLVAAGGAPTDDSGSGPLTWDVYTAWLSTEYGVTV